MNPRVQINIVENGDIVETIAMTKNDEDYYTGIDRLGRTIEFWGPNAEVGDRLATNTKQ